MTLTGLPRVRGVQDQKQLGSWGSLAASFAGSAKVWISRWRCLALPANTQDYAWSTSNSVRSRTEPLPYRWSVIHRQQEAPRIGRYLFAGLPGVVMMSLVWKNQAQEAYTHLGAAQRRSPGWRRSRGCSAPVPMPLCSWLHRVEFPCAGFASL
jgi:hypothetical protein